MSARISSSNFSFGSSPTSPTYPSQFPGHPRAVMRDLGWPNGKSIPHTHGARLCKKSSKPPKSVRVSESSKRTAEDDEGFPVARGAREVEAVDPHAGSFRADLSGLRVFPVQPMDIWSAVVFRDLLCFVLATRDVPFDHLIYLGPHKHDERRVVDVEHQDDNTS